MAAKKIAVLISDKGTGTNLQAIIDGCQSQKINGQVVVVVSDTPKALGLKRARKHQLTIEICPKKENLAAILKKYSPGFIALAGWKQIVTSNVIAAFPNRIINTHPGLIPDTLSGLVYNPDGTISLWNRGKLANQAIQNFLDNNATYAGATNHFLSNEFDFGPVLGRCFEKVRPNDTVETLYTRLKKKENALYVRVLSKLCKS